MLQQSNFNYTQELLAYADRKDIDGLVGKVADIINNCSKLMSLADAKTENYDTVLSENRRLQSEVERLTAIADGSLVQNLQEELQLTKKVFDELNKQLLEHRHKPVNREQNDNQERMTPHDDVHHTSKISNYAIEVVIRMKS